MNIQFPRGVNFDEFHYVPSAKQFLKLTENQNWEHPPLGKLIMSASIAAWGDRPIGWRFASTVFGSLTLVAMYLWALALFRKQETAFFVAIITLFNHLLYVQARIGMLDTFAFAFMAWGLTAFTAAWTVHTNKRTIFKLLAFAGAMFGLATACKWSGVIPLLFCAGLMLTLAIAKEWRVAFQGESKWKNQENFEDWYSHRLMSGFGFWRFICCFVLIPLLTYFITFVPFFFVTRANGSHYGLLDILAMQPKMYDGQLRVVTSHPYMSHWYDWPLLLRPIWYAFDHEGEKVRGVLLLGSPLVMWCGLIGVMVALWAWIKRRSREGFLISVFYLGLYLPWVLIPRKVSFYYYYYPAAMTLGFAIALVFQQVEQSRLFKSQWSRWFFAGAVLGLFVYFFPILAALKIPADAFRQWMWFRSWI